MSALEIFRMIAPEFKKLSKVIVEKWIELAKPFVSQKRFGKDYAFALALIAAHRLKMAGYGTNEFGDIGTTLRVSSFSEGEASVSFNSGLATATDADAELKLTSYGIQFIQLRRIHIIPIVSAGEPIWRS